MTATPATVAQQIVTARARNIRPVYSTRTPVLVVAETVSEEFTGPCGCSGCEKWADCYYCDGCMG